MNLSKLFEIQERLDAKVVEVHGLQGQNLTGDVTQALKRELGELAEEIGFFKYWKKNKRDDKEKQRDEWADCFHFILSLGNKYGHSQYIEKIVVLDQDTAKHVADLGVITFHRLFDVVYTADHSNLAEYYKSMCNLILIGVLIGMTEADMIAAYFTKNRINYERLASDY